VERVGHRCRSQSRPGVGVGQGSATWEGEPKWDRGPEPSQCRRFDSVHPTGQYSKKCPHVEGHALRLSARHARLRRDGYRTVYDADARHMLASGSEPRIPETTERTSCTSRSRKTKQSMWSIPPVGRSRLVRRLGERRASSRLHRTLEPKLGVNNSTPHRNDLTSAPADPILSRTRWGLSAAHCEPGLSPDSSHMVRAQVVADEIFGLVEDRRSRLPGEGVLDSSAPTGEDVMANRDSGMMDDRLLPTKQARHASWSLR
jgi:hypothetical protein